MSDIPIIILAAGTSSRLGRPKQLLLFNGKALLQHAIDVSIASGIGPVFVVLGYHSDIIRSKVDFSAADILQNDDYKEGMSSSIRIGINHVQQSIPETKGALILLCDQPGISSELLEKMAQKFNRTRKNIVACSYSDVVGVPVIFHHSFFYSLMGLHGDIGARKVILSNLDYVTIISFPEGAVDIDTEKDYFFTPQ